MRNALYILYLKTSDCDYEEGETFIGLFGTREQAADSLANLVQTWSKDGWVKGWIEEVELGKLKVLEVKNANHNEFNGRNPILRKGSTSLPIVDYMKYARKEEK